MTVSNNDFNGLYNRFQDAAGETLKTSSIHKTDYKQLTKVLADASSSTQKGHIYYTKDGLQYMTKKQAAQVDIAVKVPFAVLKEVCETIQWRSIESAQDLQQRSQLFLHVYKEIRAPLKVLEERQEQKVGKLEQSLQKIGSLFSKQLPNDKEQIKAFEKKAKAVNEQIANAADSVMIKQTLARATFLLEFYQKMETLSSTTTNTKDTKTKELRTLLTQFNGFSQGKLDNKTRLEMRRAFPKANAYLNNLSEHAQELARQTRTSILSKSNPSQQQLTNDFFNELKDYFNPEKWQHIEAKSAEDIKALFARFPEKA